MKFSKLLEFLQDFVALIYPNICAGCGEALLKNEEVICTKCLYELPKTRFHSDRENAVAQLFWGRTNVHHATAYYHFQKGSKFQELIHNLKYRGQKEIGYVLGKSLGYELKDTRLFADVNVVIPIPLHPKRERKRGYNQSEWISNGIAEAMGIAVDTQSVIRTVETQTQTKKTREERQKNVESIFQIRTPNLLIGKHILLVDDVITTGATLESCASLILSEIENVKVSIAALAVASH